MTFIISKVEKSILKYFYFAPLLIAFFFFQTKDAAAAVKMHNTGSLLPMGLGGKELTLGPMWLIPQTERQVERVFKWPPEEVKTRTCSKVKGLAVHLRTSYRCLKVFTIGGTRNQRTRRIKKVGESNSSKLTIEARAPHMH